MLPDQAFICVNLRQLGSPKNKGDGKIDMEKAKAGR